MPLFPFSVAVRELIDLALREDLYAGDVTTDAIFSLEAKVTGQIVAKERLVIAGISVVEEVFRRVDPSVRLSWHRKDGDFVEPGMIGTVFGSTRSILRSERVALNFLRRLSGVASVTESYVSLLGKTGPKLVDTRKTTPGFRELEKFAVRMGGGHNHRYNLGGGAMIKDNHIAAAGSISKAVKLVRSHAPFLLKIEVEVTNMSELKEAITAGADAVLLDNMTTEEMRSAVEWVDRRAIVEASGNITDERLADLRDIGLDVVSSGFITHSASNVDLSLKLIAENADLAAGGQAIRPVAPLLSHVGLRI